MAGTRQILQRRKAVENIRRITRTMEMISTARYKSYSTSALRSWIITIALARAGYLLVTSQKPIDHSLLKENNSGRNVVLAIGSTRGLCGQYNDSVFRMLKIHINRAKELNKKLDILINHSKLLPMLDYHGIVPAKVYTGFEGVPPDEMIELMAEGFVKEYMAGSIDLLSIVYMRFFSVTNQQVQTHTVMPLTELIDDLQRVQK